MKKKTFKVFYSWQDDIDNKLNRYFIKDCLENALSKINKAMALEEADRQKMILDHDTKDIPGIPDIANTILQKISASDIFIADLTFVSEYKNKRGVIKKISNQNVVFELGFALNVLGPHKIICIFNESSGKPENLLFDLKHRRWPISYKLNNYNYSKRKLQKEILVNKVYTAINSIITKVPFHKGKTSIHNPFTTIQHNDFEYLYEKLNTELQVFIDYQELKKSYNSPPKPYKYKMLQCQFQPILISFIEIGNGNFNIYDFRKFVERKLSFDDQLPNRNNFLYKIEYNDRELELLLRTLNLISVSGNKFYKKIYSYIHWLEYNGYKDLEVKFKKL